MRSRIFLLLLLCGTSHAQTVTQTEVHSLPQPTPTQGGDTVAFLLQAADGNFYGFSDIPGLFFKFSTTGSYSLISNPSNPAFGVNMIQGPDGAFYGPSADGGSLVRMTTNGQVASYPFPFDYGSDLYPVGYAPVGLTLGSDGYFYGAAAFGGVLSDGGTASGTFFKVSQQGKFSLLYTFTGGADGGEPRQILVQGSDGNFYGTTSTGGMGYGTIFKMTPQGGLTTLHDFSDGDYPPVTPLVEAENGSLYGIQDYATNDTDALYQIDPAGAYSVLYSANVGGDENGLSPSLFLGSDGNLYSASAVSVLQISLAGNVNTYYAEPDESEPPFGVQVLQGSDGKLYGAYDYIAQVSQEPPLPAPVQLSLSASSVSAGQPVTVNWQVLNAFSLTMQQCYGFATSGGVTTPYGKLAGTYNSTTKLFGGTASVSLPAGIYNLAITCGGIESGYAALSVGYPTATTLTANPTSVMPPNTFQLQATVKRTSASGTPGGSVTFSSGTDTLGTASLIHGVATLTASSKGIAAGTYGVTAKYSGDASDTTSTSASVNVTVE